MNLKYQHLLYNTIPSKHETNIHVLHTLFSNPPEVPVSGQESECICRSYIFRGISILPLCMIFSLDFGTFRQYGIYCSSFYQKHKVFRHQIIHFYQLSSNHSTGFLKFLSFHFAWSFVCRIPQIVCFVWQILTLQRLDFSAKNVIKDYYTYM